GHSGGLGRTGDMKTIFDRHAEALTSAERETIWQGISGTRASESRSRLLRALVTATAVVTISLITVAVVNREPRAPRGSVAVAPHILAPRVEIDAPKARSLAPRRDAALAMAESLARIPVVPEMAVRHAAPALAPPVPPAGTGVVTGVITDARNKPVEFANVVVLGTRIGAMTDLNGNFRLTQVPVGTAEIQVQTLGYEKQVQSVEVSPGATATLAFNVGEPRAVQQIEEIQVRAGRGTDTKSSSSVQSLSVETLSQLPVDNRA